MIKVVKKFMIPIILSFIILGIYLFNQEMGKRSLSVMTDYAKEMALIMPAVFLLMGFMEVWIDKEKIQKWLGEKSGLKGGVFPFTLHFFAYISF